jgi:hypothetical protein
MKVEFPSRYLKSQAHPEKASVNQKDQNCMRPSKTRRYFLNPAGRVAFTVTLMLFACFLAIRHRHSGHRAPWQKEAESIVKKDFPFGVSRSRFGEIAVAKKYFLRKPKPQIVSVHVWGHKMKNKLSFPNDSVAIDVYFDSDNKVKGYSQPYGWRID